MSLWIKYLLITGAVQGFVFAFALSRIKSPRSKAANSILIALLLVVSFFMAINSQADWLSQISSLIRLLSYTLIFTYCPLYYLFTEALYTTPFRLKRNHLLLLLPAAVFFAAWIRYAFMPAGEMAEIFSKKEYYDLLVADSVSILLNFYYIVKTWRLAAARSKDEPTLPSHRAFIIPTLGLILANLSWLSMVFAALGYPILPIASRPDILYLSMSLLILLFGCFLVLGTDLFSIQGMLKVSRYENINIADDQCQKIETEILTALDTHAPYKNPEFSLSELAALTSIDKVKLSYTINSHMGTNFSSLLNKYRVDEFVRLMESGNYDNYNMLGIASEAGFSSKSTFYKAFKDLKGQTPKEFFNGASVAVRG